MISDDINAKSGVQYHDIEADGFTVKLSTRARPIGGWNTIKLAIADVADRILDSWVLLSAGSLSCNVNVMAMPPMASIINKVPTKASKMAPVPLTSQVTPEKLKPTPGKKKPPKKAPTNSPSTLTPTSISTTTSTSSPTTIPTDVGGDMTWPAGGPCMNEVFQAYSNNNDLQCTAEEVTTIATQVEKPQECIQGSTINVNLTISIDFHATRYDFHI